MILSRISQLSRHLSRPALSPLLLLRPAASGLHSRIMAASASADERNARTIHTAACLIIGDEVLGGKTKDTNSAYMAKWCFSLGMSLKRVEVIEDDESEIVEAVRRMSDRYDFVVTSGGIGPTHDDITYASIAKAFGLPLRLHDEAYARMRKLTTPSKSQPDFSWDVESPTKTARLRMVELPTDESRDAAKQALFPCDDLWVPISVVNGNIHILPGVPRLFERLLEGLHPFISPRLVPDPDGTGISRVIISTPLPESAVAGYLAELAGRVGPQGVKVGSYPRWGRRRNTVTLVGRDRALLDRLAPEVAEAVAGRRVAAEGEDDDDPSEKEEEKK